jgi:hypothetical protein
VYEPWKGAINTASVQPTPKIVMGWAMQGSTIRIRDVRLGAKGSKNIKVGGETTEEVGSEGTIVAAILSGPG